MKTLAIDIETFSSVGLKKSGVYKYVEAPDFEVMLFAYSLDGEPVQVVDLISIEQTGPDVDDIVWLEEMRAMLVDPAVIKTAHNASFERTCIAKHFGLVLPPEQWECTQVMAMNLGLPAPLDLASKALQLDTLKDAEGKALIKYFSIPCKPTKVNGQRSRNLPEHDAEKWKRFIEYCRQDVVVEQSIRAKLAFFKTLPEERALWCLDQRINDRGIKLDLDFVQSALRIDTEFKEKLTAEAIELTGLHNPNSADQLKAWLSEELDLEVEKLRKEDIPELLKASDCKDVTRVLNIRTELAKTSVKKYNAMRAVICSDDRARGLLQFYGGSRTGRWAGRLVQVQNLPKNTEELFGKRMKTIDFARRAVLSEDGEILEMIYGNVPDTLSQLIRTAFIAPDGSRFLVADFSAIEARVIAWLAKEEWRLEVFRTHGKIYEASASQMFKVPLESVTKGSILRTKGKMAELALGYQGGPAAITRIEISNKTPVEKRIPEAELPALVKMWRNANRKIVALWYAVQEKAIAAIETGEEQKMIIPGFESSNVFEKMLHSLRFKVEHNTLFITLPSGRKLSYYRPTLVPNKFDSFSIRYEGVDQTTKQWRRIDTYGGKLVENIVQAIARDCLACAMLKLDAAGYQIVMHVHDEIVAEMPAGSGTVEEMCSIMGEPIPWAKGLLLTADGYETDYYKKDD